VSRFTAVIEYFRTDTETDHIYCPEFQCTESEAISMTRRLVNDMNALTDRIVDHARVEDSDENTVWESTR
jgi:hypothetical protein